MSVLRYAPIAFVALTACGWFSSGSSEVYEPTQTAPAGLPVGPTCRPTDLSARGTAPWKVGDAIGAWKVTAVDTEKTEAAVFTLSNGTDTTAIEIAFPIGEPGEWSTARSRLMPAKDAAPPIDLLTAAMTALRAFDLAHSTEAPFVKKEAGEIVLFKGLPPCTTSASSASAHKAADALREALKEKGLDKAVETSAAPVTTPEDGAADATLGTPPAAEPGVPPTEGSAPTAAPAQEAAPPSP